MAKNKVIFKLDKNDSIVKDGHVLYRLICDDIKTNLNMNLKSKKVTKADILKI